MEPVLVSLSKIEHRDLQGLAHLHETTMRTLLSDFGSEIVLRYYETARTDESVIGYCAYLPERRLVGWVVGSPHAGALFSQLSRPLPQFLTQFLRAVVKRPTLLRQLVTSMFFSSDEDDLDDAVELTYIGVSADARRLGVGYALMQAFLAASWEAGYRSVVLSVEKQNTGAIALYKDFGFSVIREFKEGRFDRYRMELKA